MSTLTRPHELVLSVGTTAGVAALALVLLVPLGRSGRRLRPSVSFPPGAAATARRMAVAGAVVLGSQDLATAVILRLANDRGSAGAVVLYNLAWTVFLLPWSVLAVPLATTAFPMLTGRWHAGDRAGYAAAAARTSRGIVVVSAAAAAVLVATARPVSRVVVLGAPGGVHPVVLARALVAFAPALLGYAAVAHLSRAHYARADARTPALATATGWLVAIVADVPLVAVLPRDWAAAALAAGTTVGMTLAGGWLVVSQWRAVGAEALAGVRTTGMAAVGAAVAAGLVGWAVATTTPQPGVAGSVGLFVALGALCLAIYVAIIATLDRETVRLLTHRWRTSG